MFAIPGLVLLVLTDYFKPQEYVPLLAGVPLLYLFTCLTLLGFVVDLRLGVSRLVAAPQLALALAFLAWSIATDVPNGAAELVRQAFRLLIPFSLFLLIAHVVQSFRAFASMLAVVLAMGLVLASIGVHQGLAPWGCHRLTYGQGTSHAVYDGRACTDSDPRSCARDDAEPGVDYMCERIGVLGTQSVGGRVRFRGTMEDPNELSIAVCIVIPFAIAFFDDRRTLARVALVVATVAVAGVCAVFTRSRGGQIVFLAVMSFYFVKRLGVRGALLGLACALPILLLGGRDTEEAVASTAERLGCWSAGIQMLRSSPLLGVGLGQFVEHHVQTAHNSYVLTAAELGFPGMLLWTSIVYVSLKVPLGALSPAWAERAPIASVARPWAVAIGAALTGAVAGMLFLSYAYKEVLWIYLGLSGALYQAIRRHDPSFSVRFGKVDLALVAAVDALLIVATTAYTSVKLG